MVTVQMATIPQRIEGLQRVVDSLINQCDLMFVALNGHNDVPSFLGNNKKIVTVMTDNSLGDAAKFYDIDKRTGYVFTCDDDLIYPPDYVAFMLKGLNRHGGIVSLLGKRYDKRPINSFRSGYTAINRCLTRTQFDLNAHLLGTGAMAFNTKDIKLSIDDFPVPNMADIWLSKAAHEQGVKMTAIKHPARYVRHMAYSHRIWITERGNNAYQTEVLNSFLK